jgi:hypothetical protein
MYGCCSASVWICRSSKSSFRPMLGKDTIQLEWGCGGIRGGGCRTDRGARWLGKSSGDLGFSSISTGKWKYVWQPINCVAYNRLKHVVSRYLQSAPKGGRVDPRLLEMALRGRPRKMVVAPASGKIRKSDDKLKVTTRDVPRQLRPQLSL